MTVFAIKFTIGNKIWKKKESGMLRVLNCRVIKMPQQQLSSPLIAINKRAPTFKPPKDSVKSLAVSRAL